MKIIVSVVLIGLLAGLCLAADKEQPPKPAQSIPELQQQLEKILKDNRVPGVSVAIVKRDAPEWIGAVGLADVASTTPATADTRFRIGSTSKAFVSLSILKLVNEGKLSLTDPVHKLAPEVWFDNPWEATDPVLVVDLLEHTTGWDDMHLREYANDAPASMGLREALDYDHTSRVSRWPPGTRTAYCNSGPAVAAYIVEKITGKRFEDYAQENFFDPIGMKSASYFQTPAPSTTLYHDDGKTPFPYWNIMYRPAGSINASAKDMAAYVAFYLNRGTVNGVEVMPAASIDRMENPTRTWAAQEGLKAGYGLSNYWSVNDGFVYHGHDGGVNGGLTEMAYMPEYGVGYFYSINSGNGDAFDKIGKAIRAYITRELTKPTVPAVGALPADADSYTGWYEPDSPRVQLFYFFERLLGMVRVHFADGKMLIRPVVDDDGGDIPAGVGQAVPQGVREGSGEPCGHSDAVDAGCGRALHSDQCWDENAEASFHRAGDNGDRAHGVCGGGDGVGGVVCAVLDAGRIDSQTAASPGTRHAVVAADRGAEPGGYGGAGCGVGPGHYHANGRTHGVVVRGVCADADVCGGVDSECGGRCGGGRRRGSG